MDQELFKIELDRRQFIRNALAASAATIASRGITAEVSSMRPTKVPMFAAFTPLPPGAVRAAGWLQTYLEKQAAQLTSHLPQVSSPFTRPYWAGEESPTEERKEYFWFPWEQKAYWIDGATRLALVLQDRQLLRQALAPINYTLAHVGTDGYLGPDFEKYFKGNNNRWPSDDLGRWPTDGLNRWPHTIFFRALSAASDGNSVPGVPEAMQRHYLSDTADYSKAPRNITNVEEMLWCYERTGDPRLLSLAEKAWQEFSLQAGIPKLFPNIPDHCDLSAYRVFKAVPIDAHGVSYAEVSKQPAILYLYTGNPKYLRFAVAAQRRIFDHHMLIDGAPSTSEYYRDTSSLGNHETCDIIDHTWTWGYLLMATGEGVWGDRVERACFNAGLGAIKKDWKALQYFSFPNQVAETAFQPNPGPCCAGNVHRLLPNYVIRMWMHDNNGGLAATLYGPSTVKTTVGAEHQEIEIVQETDYPFGEEIHFTINTNQAILFPLSLRIPAWCAAPSLMINGKPVTLPAIKNGFATLTRQFNPKDTVTLILPMKAAVSHWPQDGIAIEHGPLVYSLAVKENWSSTVDQKNSTPEFPNWQAAPASDWNYGIALGPGPLETHVILKRKPMVQDPWVDPPVALTVPVRKIEDWDLQPNPDKSGQNLTSNDPNQNLTPPLPDLSLSDISDTIEHADLVPYGSTHLRLTIFSDLTKRTRS